jgi:hypothetical protein
LAIDGVILLQEGRDVSDAVQCSPISRGAVPVLIMVMLVIAKLGQLSREAASRSGERQRLAEHRSGIEDVIRRLHACGGTEAAGAVGVGFALALMVVMPVIAEAVSVSRQMVSRSGVWRRILRWSAMPKHPKQPAKPSTASNRVTRHVLK